jgi:CheY-like chemotaxis protein/AraC-like DNA-binding protein
VLRQPPPPSRVGASTDARIDPRRSVLVVDDDAGVRDALRLVLGDDYTVLEAMHGRAAIDLVRARPIDLVILDILMPDVDGLEVLQELKALAPDLPVIMMTAVKTVRTTVAAMKLGAADYVTKPFQEDELRVAIHRAIDARAESAGAVAARAESRADARPRTHRLLMVGGDVGWRATLGVAVKRAAGVATAATLVDGLNAMLRFRPTCVVLNVLGSADEPRRFLGALNAQLPACPVFVVSDDAYLGAANVWESLNIRCVLPPSVTSGELLSRLGAVLAPSGSWPQLGEVVSRTIDYLSQHFDEDLTVDAIAEITDISPSHLAHLFRSETGMSVKDYLTRVRVAVAQDLLAGSAAKLESVAMRVGFVDTSHLAHVFQRITGRPPSTYRRQAG